VSQQPLTGLVRCLQASTASVDDWEVPRGGCRVQWRVLLD